MTTYDFNAQLHIGQEGENSLDAYFEQWYFILPVPMPLQKRGIDRVFINRETLQPSFVEYKTDVRAAETGNVFIEVISVDTTGKLGWAHTSKAHVLVYYLPQKHEFYTVEFKALRSRLNIWEAERPLKSIPNNGYNTKGVVVPIGEFAQLGKVHHIS